MPNIQIKVHLADYVNSCGCCAACETIAAVVINLETNYSFICHFRASDNALLLDEKNNIVNENSYFRAKAYQKYEDTKHWNEARAKKFIEKNIHRDLIDTTRKYSQYKSTVMLEANGNFDQFIKKYKESFDKDINTHRRLTNNCATAVNFVLNHFFPKQPKLRGCHTSFRLLCSPVSLFGAISCLPCPTPPCVDAPEDAYREALLLKFFAKSSPEKKSAPATQKMEEKKVAEVKANSLVA